MEGPPGNEYENLPGDAMESRQHLDLLVQGFNDMVQALSSEEDPFGDSQERATQIFHLVHALGIGSDGMTEIQTLARDAGQIAEEDLLEIDPLQEKINELVTRYQSVFAIENEAAQNMVGEFVTLVGTDEKASEILRGFLTVDWQSVDKQRYAQENFWKAISVLSRKETKEEHSQVLAAQEKFTDMLTLLRQVPQNFAERFLGDFYIFFSALYNEHLVSPKIPESSRMQYQLDMTELAEDEDLPTEQRDQLEEIRRSFF